MKTFISEAGRTQPAVAKADPASFVDTSIVKAVEDEVIAVGGKNLAV